MISRRNIRIKVMQLLYAIDTTGSEDSPKNFTQLEKQLKNQIAQTNKLIAFLLFNIIYIVKFADTYAKQLAAKNIVTNDDLNFNTKIANNIITKKIASDLDFNKIVEEEKLNLLIDSDFIRKTFLQLIQSDEYKQYNFSTERNKNSEEAILQYIFTDLLLPNEAFIQYIEEHFTNWDDDCDTAEQMILQYIQKPQTLDLKDDIGKTKWDFAKDLLRTPIEKNNILMELIKPKLKNWEADRVASIDKILLKMGVSELLYFETIPPKATINEYIDIAKDYSTKQSGQFVNGILDSIHKDLLSQNKIHKTDFRTL